VDLEVGGGAGGRDDLSDTGSGDGGRCKLGGLGGFGERLRVNGREREEGRRPSKASLLSGGLGHDSSIDSDVLWSRHGWAVIVAVYVALSGARGDVETGRMGRFLFARWWFAVL
jgi:hypothetical protein